MIKLFCSKSVLSSLWYFDVSVRFTYDQCADGAESGDALAGAVVEFDLDEVLLGL